MSLSFEDLQSIRQIVEETVAPINGELKALTNDIKEIYEMLNKQDTSNNDESFQRLSLEKKILKLHSELMDAAKQAGITLPTN